MSMKTEFCMSRISFVLKQMLLHGAHGVLHSVLHAVFAGYYKINREWVMIIRATKLAACNHWMSPLKLMCCCHNISSHQHWKVY